MLEELIVLKQLPIIEESLKSMSEEIDKEVAEAKSLVCTEETIQTVKKVRTELGNKFKALEEQRKSLKAAVMNPYEAFNEVYKKYVTEKFTSADADLKSKIDETENAVKAKTREEVTAYFNEYATSKGIDFVGFERSGVVVNLSTKANALKKVSKEYLDKISDELLLIDTQENKAEILVEYKASLNVAGAITAVANRHKAIEAEKKRQDDAAIASQLRRAHADAVEAVAESLAAPEILRAPEEIEEQLYEATFVVTATLDKLRALSAFLSEGGYKFESE